MTTNCSDPEIKSMTTLSTMFLLGQTDRSIRDGLNKNGTFHQADWVGPQRPGFPLKKLKKKKT